MSVIELELLVELGLVLLAPWIHQAYLWRKGKPTREGRWLRAFPSPRQSLD